MVNVSKFKREHQEPEYVYGRYDPVSNKWNGILEKLAKNETDIGVGEFAMTTERLDYFEFSLPILVSPAKYYIRKPNDNVLQWSMYFKVSLKSLIYIYTEIEIQNLIIITLFSGCWEKMRYYFTGDYYCSTTTDRIDYLG